MSCYYGGEAILKNNIELGANTKFIEENKTQAWIVGEVGTSPAYVSRIVNSKENIVNKTFLSMIETLRYEVRLVYAQRNPNA